MIKKYLTYTTLVMLSILMVSCGSAGDGGNNVDKSFLDKYKYTIKSEAQADEYATNDSFLKVNDKKVDFIFNILGVNEDDDIFQGSLFFKIDDNTSGNLIFTALKKEKKFELNYYTVPANSNNRLLISKPSLISYEPSLTNKGSIQSDLGTLELDLKNQDLLFIIPKTELKQTAQGKESVFVEFSISDKAVNVGSASLSVNGDEILIDDGDLGKKTYRILKKLLNDNPNVDTIVLGNLNGSVDDEINVETGRMIRAKGLNTKVLANSEIASGAVDLFASGVERIYTKGAKVGVHSWSDGGKTGAEYPKDDEAHHSQLGYFTAMLPDTGYDFYFYTLSAAPADNIYFMSQSEILKYKLATKIVK